MRKKRKNWERNGEKRRKHWKREVKSWKKEGKNQKGKTKPGIRSYSGSLSVTPRDTLGAW